MSQPSEVSSRRTPEVGPHQARECGGAGEFLQPLPLVARLEECRQEDRKAIINLSAILGLPYGPDHHADMARRVIELAALEDRVRSATLSSAASPAPVPPGTPVR